MEIIRGFCNVKSNSYPCVATIGNFDGIHRGHQYLLEELQKQSKQRQLPSAVITFEPHPKEFFNPESAPARLTRIREKLYYLEKLGIDEILVLRFNQQLADLTPEAFIQKIILHGLKIKYLIVGKDFHFGKERQGNVQLLKQLADKYAFIMKTVSTQTISGERISSSAVRQALQQGDLAKAEKLLGRPYSMCGRVVHGDKRGRIMGFPTANIYLHRHLSPLQGVFAVRVHGLGDVSRPGVCNLGNRPTLDGSRTLLEVHLFNFHEEIYGRYLQVDFVHKIRDEEKFSSFDELKAQILQDAKAAQMLLRNAD